MKKFKKGDKAYIIATSKYDWYHQNPIVVSCEIEKVTTEDRVKSWNQKEIYRRKPKIIEASVNYPSKMAWINYIDPKGELHEEWVYQDVLKRNPNEFKEFIN